MLKGARRVPTHPLIGRSVRCRPSCDRQASRPVAHQLADMRGSPELRNKIEAQVRFATTLDRARIHRRGGRGWLPVRGPVRLTVGTDAFIFPARKAFGECAFREASAPLRSA